MVIVMDMSTGKIDYKQSPEEAAAADAAADAAEEFGPFVDEVLNAGWLPQPAPHLETHHHTEKTAAAAVDADEFLRALYRNQE